MLSRQFVLVEHVTVEFIVEFGVRWKLLVGRHVGKGREGMREMIASGPRYFGVGVFEFKC